MLEKYTKDQCGREKEFWCIVETNCLNIQQSFPIEGAEYTWLVDLDRILYIDDERNPVDDILREGFHLFHFPYLFTKRSKWRWENEARFVMSSWGQGNVLPGWRSVQGLDPLPSIMYCVVDPAIFVDTIWFSEKRHYYAALRKIPTLGENFWVRLEAKEMIVKDLALKAREAVPLIDTLALKNDYQE